MRWLLPLACSSLLLGCSPRPIEPTPIPTAFPYETPAWFDGAVVYEVFVRSYADSDADGIGDLEGVRRKLDYLESLSVDVLWLMPIYPSPSVHGYDVTDFTAVNPEYGSHADLEALVRDAHQRGIRIILDFVPSHLSREHPFFQDALGNVDSPWSDWFAWTNEAHTSYASFASLRELPRLNHYHPPVVEFLVEAALFWLDLDQDGDTTDGIDGFRVDNVTFPPDEFLETFRQRVKQANPQALLLGEAWVHSPRDLSRYFSGKFDALFDFPLYEILQGDPGFNGDGLLAGRGHPVLLNSLMLDESERFPSEAYPIRFLNNHDTNRIASEMKGSIRRQELGAALLTTLPGPILIYYGEEIGMLGEKGGAPHWDSYRREPMDWYQDQVGESQTTWFQVDDPWNVPGDGISVEEQDTQAGSLLNTYRQVLRLRRDFPVLKIGDFETLDLIENPAGVWAFQRSLPNDRYIVLVNFSDEIAQVRIAYIRLEPLDLISRNSIEYDSSEGSTILELPAAVVLFFRQLP